MKTFLAHYKRLVMASIVTVTLIATVMAATIINQTWNGPSGRGPILSQNCATLLNNNATTPTIGFPWVSLLKCSGATTGTFLPAFHANNAGTVSYTITGLGGASAQPNTLSLISTATTVPPTCSGTVLATSGSSQTGSQTFGSASLPAPGDYDYCITYTAYVASPVVSITWSQ